MTQRCPSSRASAADPATGLYLAPNQRSKFRLEKYSCEKIIKCFAYRRLPLASSADDTSRWPCPRRCEEGGVDCKVYRFRGSIGINQEMSLIVFIRRLSSCVNAHPPKSIVQHPEKRARQQLLVEDAAYHLNSSPGLSATRPLRDRAGSTLRLDADPIVNSVADPLLAAKVSFGCLH